MSRQKQQATRQRVPTQLSDMLTSNQRGREDGAAKTITAPAQKPQSDASASQAGLLQLIICVLGIYASFLSWGVLQEKITTTSYQAPATATDPNPAPERFTFSVVLNTIQSSFAAITGFAYLYLSRPSGGKVPSPFPNKAILFPLALVSLTSSLASPFGYASLAHIDYLTFILAKSCKLLPVMLLHLTVFRKRYPLYKYAVVFMVTLGVATFTLHHPTSSRKPKTATTPSDGSNGKSSTWGLFLLFINLLLDGLTNTTQDHIFSSPHLYTRFSGPQMMVAVNVLSTAFTAAYLVLAPHLSAHIASYLPLSLVEVSLSESNVNELGAACGFLGRYPAALKNVLAFAACGAVGQLFIFYTLAHFSSLLLVTVTVTRKMLTMLLSVVWFGHRLNKGQWAGVGLVFGGVGAEAIVQKREKEKRAAKKGQ